MVFNTSFSMNEDNNLPGWLKWLEDQKETFEYLQEYLQQKGIQLKDNAIQFGNQFSNKAKKFLNAQITPRRYLWTTVALGAAVSAALLSRYDENRIHNLESELSTVTAEKQDLVQRLEGLEEIVLERDSLQEIVAYYDENLQSFIITRRFVETTPELLDMRFYEPIVRADPRTEILLKALIKAGKEYYELGYDKIKGHGIAPILASLALMMTELHLGLLNRGYIRESDGTIRMTCDTSFIANSLMSSTSAAGPAQMEPFFLDDYGIGPVIKHESFDGAWNLRRPVRDAKSEASTATNNFLAYLRGIIDIEADTVGEISDEEVLRWSRRDYAATRLDSIMQAGFNEYNQLVADSVACRTMEEIAGIEARFHVDSLAKGITYAMADYGFEENWDPLRSASRYYTGSPVVGWDAERYVARFMVHFNSIMRALTGTSGAKLEFPVITVQHDTTLTMPVLSIPRYE